MSYAIPHHPADPIRWHVAIAAIFAALCAVRLTIPSTVYFDEVHYLPAVRNMLALSHATNLEHPPLGKELIALGVILAGDNPLGWRIMPLLAGTLSIYAGMRALWFAGGSRAASLLTGLFLVTGFPLLVHARIAMLDIFMLAFVLVGLWMCAGAVRENETARWRLAIAGAAMGAAMASKWNAIPLAVLPGMTFLFARLQVAGWHFVDARRGWPVAGMPLWEAAVWLGVLPMAIYAASYWPYPLFDKLPGNPSGLFALHANMLDLQTQVLEPHPYQSKWWQWIANQRGIWYLYEQADGAQRGILLIGNPLSSLAALPALAWCALAAWRNGRHDAGAVVILYLASMALWILAPKAVQFYYHYALPHCFGMAALALATERLWQRGERLVPTVIVLGSAGLFAYFYPILTAAPLDGEMAFLEWAWIDGWR